MTDTDDPGADSIPVRRRRWIRARAVLGAVLVIVLGMTGTWIFTHQQRVSDQFTVWQFAPSSTAVSYAKRTTMTAEGRLLFYASRPQISASASFDAHCASELEGVGILGCFVHAERRIYLFDVTDTRLDGIEEVVAAHEMLHAAWDRMSQAQRDDLAPVLEAEAATRSSDAALQKTLDYYASAEPGERLNELHSIIGTEFGNINSRLEKHYAKYFSDRAAVVAFHAASNGVFTERQSEIADLVTQLDTLRSDVNTDYAKYNSGYDSLNQDITTFNAKADQQGAFTQQQFDTEKAALQARQAELDALYASIATRTTDYEGLVKKLEELNAEVTELNKSINISPRNSTQSPREAAPPR